MATLRYADAQPEEGLSLRQGYLLPSCRERRNRHLACTLNIPSDIDFRIMLTFLELYQTLLGFTFFKLYTDINLVYPPKLDAAKDDDAAGIGALLLEETSRTLTIEGKKGTEDSLANGAAEKKVTAKDVKKQIRQITHGASSVAASAEAAEAGEEEMAIESTSAGVSEFPAPLEGGDAAPAVEEDISGIFEPYFFYLSREVTRPTLEFILRSFGGQVGWDPILGAGSPFSIGDPRITHHIIDRPVPVEGGTSALVPAGQDLPGKRAYIQPQWVVDCINQKKLLPTEAYAPGETLPPHLSPFVDEQRVREQGGYIPTEAGGEEVSEAESDEEEAEEDVAVGGDDEEFTGFGEGDDEEADASMAVETAEAEDADEAEEEEQARPALLAAAANPDDASLMHAAELEAETLHIPYSKFSSDLAALRKASAAASTSSKNKASTAEAANTQEANPASILLSNKQRKLFNKMKYGENKRNLEAQNLREKKKMVNKEQNKKGASARK